MASFEIALKKILILEGKYNADPLDIGGETYCGISRKYHPLWSGWRLIDEAKLVSGQLSDLEGNCAVAELVTDFYHQRYWRNLNGDRIIDQSLAEELFEMSVNLGLKRTAKFLQKSINALNFKNHPGQALAEDGKIGQQTLAGLDRAILDSSATELNLCLNIYQGIHYLNLVRRRPEQKRFLKGWLSRVKI